jgi:hypothetical protein
MDCSEIINILISSIIGLGLSYFAAWSYERFKHKRHQKNQREIFQHLESPNNEFDWQHWDVREGKIVDNPIDAFMKMKYLHDGEFDFEWTESKGGVPQGSGRLIFDNQIKGILYFFSHFSINYKYRNIFFREIEHKGKKYEAIFVDAADEGYKYALMREL